MAILYKTGVGAVLLLLFLATSLPPAFAGLKRDSAQRAVFLKKQPCPATGKTRGRCPGYVVDHIKPLCAGGADHWSNMQWQTVAEAKVKDREERRMCNRR